MSWTSCEAAGGESRAQRGLAQGRGLELTQVYDETEYIISAVALVRENIFIGGALTMIVLMSSCIWACAR
jgi:hypothetical protein